MEKEKAKTATPQLPPRDALILCEGRQRIAATIDEKVNTEIKSVHEKEKELAQKEDRPEPPLSHTIEKLLRKGLKAYDSEK